MCYKRYFFHYQLRADSFSFSVKSALPSLPDAMSAKSCFIGICYYRMNFYIGMLEYLYWNRYTLVWLFCEHKHLPSKQVHHVTVKKYSKPSIYNIILVASEKKNIMYLNCQHEDMEFIFSLPIKVFFFCVMAPGLVTAGFCRVRNKSSFAAVCSEGLFPLALA